MKLLVISHKETWADPTSPTGYSTIGGFPFQVAALSELFDQTTVMVPIRQTPLPAGRTVLAGRQLSVHPLKEPRGQGFRRKLSIMGWLPKHLSSMWKAVHKADAIHLPVPGDIGTIGLFISLLQRKRLFIRHCGCWGTPVSPVDRFLQWALERIAGGRNVVLATGGGDLPPSPCNEHIQWIFATTLRETDLTRMPFAKPWQPEEALRLVIVGSLRPGKNTASLIDALPTIATAHPNIRLDIVGTGECYHALLKQSQMNNLESQVVFHGNVNHSQVLKILAQAHIFVFPSFYEGFPKALLEAMACRLPIIASPVSVIPHLVEQGCGLLLEDTSPKAVADAVIKMIADPIRMQAMGETARKVAAEYSLERWRDEIKVCLESAWGLPLQTGATESLLKNMANQSERVRSTNQNCR